MAITKSVDIFSETNRSTTILGGQSVFNTVQNLTAMDVDYEALKLQADYKDNVARDIEMKATQEANFMREQFSENMGRYTYGTARRNVKAGEAGTNLEDSSRDFGVDMAKYQGNADYKAQQMRDEANRLRAGAEGTKQVNDWKRISGLFAGFSDVTKIFESYKETKTGTNPPPPTPVQIKKPTIVPVKKQNDKPFVPSDMKGEEVKPEGQKYDPRLVTPNRIKLPPAQKTKLVELMNKGMSANDIAVRLNLDQTAVELAMKQMRG